jgi:hypothetical protein
MKWIVKIIDAYPYQVTCLWNDGITRTVDLEKFILEKSMKTDSSYGQLLNKQRFNEVKCDGTTLCWENGITMLDLDGFVKPAALDIDPDVLFEIAVPAHHGKKRRTREPV